MSKLSVKLLLAALPLTVMLLAGCMESDEDGAVDVTTTEVEAEVPVVEAPEVEVEAEY